MKTSLFILALSFITGCGQLAPQLVPGMLQKDAEYKIARGTWPHPYLDRITVDGDQVTEVWKQDLGYEIKGVLVVVYRDHKLVSSTFSTQ